jgi:hypothetical protein
VSGACRKATLECAGALQLVYYDAKTGGACRECLFDRDIDAADPCLIHAHMGDEIAAAIRDRDIHGLTQFLSFPLRRVELGRRLTTVQRPTPSARV